MPQRSSLSVPVLVPLQSPLVSGGASLLLELGRQLLIDTHHQSEYLFYADQSRVPAVYSGV